MLLQHQCSFDSRWLLNTVTVYHGLRIITKDIFRSVFLAHITHTAKQLQAANKWTKKAILSLKRINSGRANDALWWAPAWAEFLVKSNGQSIAFLWNLDKYGCRAKNKQITWRRWLLMHAWRGGRLEPEKLILFPAADLRQGWDSWRWCKDCF